MLRHRLALTTLLLLAFSCRPPDLEMNEFPPQLANGLFGIPLDGGRVHSIAVNPVRSGSMIVACQWGGFWETPDGGARWYHVDGLPSVFAADVAFSPDGRTIVATIARDNRTTNGGGIWVSRDGAASWTQPPSAVPPPSPRNPARISGAGISFAPDIPGRVYAGTDHGVAVSNDDGSTWNHFVLDPRCGRTPRPPPAA